MTSPTTTTDRDRLLRDMARLGAGYGASIAVVVEASRTFAEALRESFERVSAHIQADAAARRAEPLEARIERLSAATYRERVARERRLGLAYVDRVVRETRLELGLPLEDPPLYLRTKADR